MLNQVGSVVCVQQRPRSWFRARRHRCPITKMLDEPGRKASACWSTCTGPGLGAGIATGDIIPNGACARCKPDVEGVEEDAVRIVRIHRDSLVVPVLRIIDGRFWQSLSDAALRSLHVSPARAAIGGSPDAELTSVGAAATAAVIPIDRLRLRVDDVRVARRDCDVDASS